MNQTDKSQRFTADEHSAIIRQEFSEVVPSRDAILRQFLSRDASKLITLAYLIRFAYQHDARKILSLGAGMCIIEELLRQSLPEDSIVVATDFDDYMIGNAQRFFPELVALPFDFFKDDVKTLCDTADTTFDIAIFMGSSYVMDDEEYIRILNQLIENHVKIVIDLTSTLIPYHKLPRLILGEIKCTLTREDRGKFHGFQRTRLDFRNLYKKAGWNLKEETTVVDYNYVAILENK